MKMRYSTKPRFRIYVKSYGFLWFAKNFDNKYGKRLIDSATKTGIEAAKTTSKRIVQKTAEATGDLIGNKIADKTTSIGKPKKTQKKNRRNWYSTRKKATNYWSLKTILNAVLLNVNFIFFVWKWNFKKLQIFLI